MCALYVCIEGMVYHCTDGYSSVIFILILCSNTLSDQTAIWIQRWEHHWWLDHDGVFGGQWFYSSLATLTYSPWCFTHALGQI